MDLPGRRWWHEELAGEDPSSTVSHGVGASDNRDVDAAVGRTPPPWVPPPRAWRMGHRSGRGCLLALTASPSCTGGEKACAAMRGGGGGGSDGGGRGGHRGGGRQRRGGGGRWWRQSAVGEMGGEKGGRDYMVWGKEHQIYMSLGRWAIWADGPRASPVGRVVSPYFVPC
jgi:hypothetical protein